MDVLVLIDKLDDLVHNARPVPLTDQVRVDREEIYDLLDQMRATIPEEIKQARWIVKERQEMLEEAKRESERVVREAREQQARLVSDEEVTKQAERAADEIVEDARAREREIRLGAEDYADEILNTLETENGASKKQLEESQKELAKTKDLHSALLTEAGPLEAKARQYQELEAKVLLYMSMTDLSLSEANKAKITEIISSYLTSKAN